MLPQVCQTSFKGFPRRVLALANELQATLDVRARVQNIYGIYS
jgi:hypothetical protein